jgi:excisionase family DNA binding protein
MPSSKLLSVAQVSARLQCARSTVRKPVADGKLRASRISSRTIMISRADLQAYLDGRANVSAPPEPSAKGTGASQ